MILANNSGLSIIQEADSTGKCPCYFLAIFDNAATVTIAVYAAWDVVMDCHIDMLDVIQVGNHWGEIGELGWIREDVNDDGMINMLDVIMIGNHWGE